LIGLSREIIIVDVSADPNGKMPASSAANQNFFRNILGISFLEGNE